MLAWRVDGRGRYSWSLSMISFMIPSVSPAYAPLLGYHNPWVSVANTHCCTVAMQADLTKSRCNSAVRISDSTAGVYDFASCLNGNYREVAALKSQECTGERLVPVS